MTGVEFIRRASRYAKRTGQDFRLEPSRGKGSHARLWIGRRFTTVNPDYSSHKHKMNKRARHVESDQRVTGYPQKTAGTRPG